MSSGTRGPRPGRVPPHVQQRLDAKRARREAKAARGPWFRRPWFAGVLAGLAGLGAGVVLGRSTAPDPVIQAAAEAEELVAAADQGALLWQVGLQDGTPPVKAGLDALRRNDPDPGFVATNLDAWLTAYEQLSARLTRGGVPAAGDGVRRLLLAAAQLDREAVQALGAAATVAGPARPILLTEVDRLHAQAQSQDRSARALLAALQGQPEPDTPTEAPTAPSLPRPRPPAAAPGPTGQGATAPTPAASGTVMTTPQPSPTVS